MTNKKILFIGAGNMGSAIIGGMGKKSLTQNNHIAFYEPDQAVRKRVETTFNIEAIDDLEDRISMFDIVVFAIKPQVFMGLKDSPITKNISGEQTIISIMAGVTIATIAEFIPNALQIVRVMPNTPAMIEEGMSVLCKSDTTSEESMADALEIFGSVGQTEVLAESYIDAVTGLSGSGPAFVLMFIEALTQGGVLSGLPKPVAEKLALQTVYGTTKMAMCEGKSVEQLRHMVTSPAGTTIAGVATLEANGFRHATMQAVYQATNRSKELGKK